jgi:hypothetical protein
MKRLIAFLFLAASSAAASLFWLHNGELDATLEPIVSVFDGQSTPSNSRPGAGKESTGY